LSRSYSYGQIRKRESASSLVKASDAISNPAALADRNSGPTPLGGETSFLTDINSKIIQSTLNAGICELRHDSILDFETQLSLEV